MKTLNEKHKQFIILNLACYVPSVVLQNMFKLEFGFKISLSVISYYNIATINSDRRLAQRWKDLFESTRKKYNDSIAAIPIANQVYRLKKMQDHFDSFTNSNNIKAAQAILVDAAKESGGAYTNKVEHTGDITKRIVINGVTPDPEEWEKIATVHMQNMIGLVEKMRKVSNPN